MFKQTLLAAVVAASIGALALPAVAAPGVVVVRVGPPAMREEAMPAPRRGYDWSPGYWNWERKHNRHQWMAGHWVRSRPGYVYAQPTWVERGDRWELQRGAWGRRDNDRDGVRNSQDRKPNDPRRN